MNLPLESAAVYLLGFVGLAAAGLVPYRSWLLMIAVFNSNALQSRRRSLLFVAALVSAAALWGDVQICARVFACLTEAYCGPSIASGWGYLAMLGVVYVAFEAMSYLLRKMSRSRAGLQ